MMGGIYLYHVAAFAKKKDLMRHFSQSDENGQDSAATHNSSELFYVINLTSGKVILNPYSLNEFFSQEEGAGGSLSSVLLIRSKTLHLSASVHASQPKIRSGN